MKLARRLFRVCLLAQPPEFRARYGDAVMQTFDEQLSRARGASRYARLRLVVGESANVLATGLLSRGSARRSRSRRQPRPRPRPRPRRRGSSFTIWRDIRVALRSLSRSKGFAFGALLLLSLGIGANTAMFSLLDAYLLRSLPFDGSERLVSVRPVARDAPPSLRRSVLEEIAWPARDAVIEEAVTWDLDVFTLVDGERPEVVSGAWVPPSYFRALGTKAIEGRLFGDADGRPGAAPVAVLGHELWERRFGGAPDVVGRSLTLYASDRPEEAETFTIVGVLPPDFWFVNTYTELFTNLTSPQMPYLVRLREGVTAEQAAAHLTGVVRAQLSGIDPGWPGMIVTSTHASYVRAVRPVLLALAAAVGLVLLIACGNVALLLSVRALSRSSELALRRAFGASRWRIAAELGAEGALLAGAASLAGLSLAWLALGGLAPVIQTQLGLDAPGSGGTVRIHGGALGVTLGLAVLVTALFTLAPCLATGRDLASSLGALARRSSDTKAQKLARNGVIACEVGLSLALLVGASLMLRTAVHLHQLDLGFEPRGVLSAYVSLRQRSYEEPSRLVGFVDRFLERVRTTPGVASASAVTGVFPFQARHDAAVLAEGNESSEPARAGLYVVTPQYLETLAIRVLAGRAFTEGDRSDSAPVAILSDDLAESLWPGASPLGRRIRLGIEGPEAPRRTVVGLVPDVRESLTENPTPDAYVPFAQLPSPYVYVLAQLTAGSQNVIPALERAVWDVDDTAALTRVTMLDDLVESQRLRPRFLAVLLVAFSLFAVALAVTGLYSIVAYAVSQKKRDIAIHVALGASYDEIVSIFLRRGLLVTTVGVAAGLLVSLAGARLLASQLYGVTMLDVPTYAAAAAALSAASIVAVWLPARRAARTDPLPVLRQE